MSSLLHFPPLPTTADSDADQRTAALDIRQSFIVEAPAGSGKTALLIQRFLSLLADENITDPAQVLAITFTRKSTHEMRDRIFKQLQAAADNEPISPSDDLASVTRLLALSVLARDRALGWNLLSRQDRLNIATIDALCVRIANAIPVVTGAGEQSPVDDASHLYAAAARQILDRLGGDNPALTDALRTLLLHRDGNLRECEELLAGMLGSRDQWANLVPLSPTELSDNYLDNTTRARLEKALEQAICRALTVLNDLMPASLCDELSQLAHEMSYSEGYNGNDNPLVICRSLRERPSAAAASLEHWKLLAQLLLTKDGTWRTQLRQNNLAFLIQADHQQQLASLIVRLRDTPGLNDALCSLTKLPPLKYPEDQWLVLKALFRILSHALTELEYVFEDRAECDFIRFALLARQALGSSNTSSDLSTALGVNLQHLLVDEMQDTSSSQYDLLTSLIRHWDGRTRTVFVVGDPRQSIYLFRHARVQRFIETLQQRRLGDVTLTPIFLSRNFRSQGALVEDFNQAFTAIFPASPANTSEESLPYREVNATREADADKGMVWHSSTWGAPPSPGRRQRLQENAAEIRKLVKDWRRRPLPRNRSEPWKIAVLVLNRAHLLQIVRAFKQDPPISFRAIKIEPLAERQEILDLLALTRALLHPADRTAWLALLRTPWCGLTRRDLHILTGQDDEAYRKHTVLDLIVERGDLISEDGAARLRHFQAILTAARSHAGRVPLSQLVERTWRAFGSEVFCDSEESANTARFFELLDELDATAGPVSIAVLDAKMSKLYAAESTTPGAVDLMTIHNSKGLEWDFVVVPELESSTGNDRHRLLTWTEIESGSEDSVARGMIAPLAQKGGDTVLLAAWIRSIQAARDAAERKRLFYVACTRAKEEIHLFASPKLKDDGTVDVHYKSLLRAAWPTAASQFSNISADPLELPQIAASGLTLLSPAETSQRPTIDRIPLQYFHSPGKAALAPAPPSSDHLHRPQGSFEARAIGNATHTFLELLATRIASGSAPRALLAELPTWSARITAVVRASGLPHHQATAAVSTILRSLSHTLHDPEGRWLLTPHSEAASEMSLSTLEATIRIDRTFLAGEAPRAPGLTHRWMIDFKTGTHGAQGIEVFLAGERDRYAPQLESYARLFAANAYPIRLALYYPALPKLIWWPYHPLLTIH